VHYCDLTGSSSTSATWGLWYTPDGSVYFTMGSSNATGPIASRTFSMRTEYTLAGGWRCETDWPAATARLEGTKPALDAQRVGIGTKGVDVRLSWFIQIHSD